MRYLLFAFSLLLLPMSPARAEVNIGIGIGFPSIDIGIDVPYYPQLVRVPGRDLLRNLHNPMFFR